MCSKTLVEKYEKMNVQYLLSKGKVAGSFGEDKRMWNRSLLFLKVFIIKLANTICVFEGHCIRDNLSPLPNLITAMIGKCKLYKHVLTSQWFEPYAQK